MQNPLPHVNDSFITGINISYIYINILGSVKYSGNEKQMLSDEGYVWYLSKYNCCILFIKPKRDIICELYEIQRDMSDTLSIRCKTLQVGSKAAIILTDVLLWMSHGCDCIEYIDYNL